jgi:hypothetical protein
VTCGIWLNIYMWKWRDILYDGGNVCEGLYICWCMYMFIVISMNNEHINEIINIGDGKELVKRLAIYLV